jgi:hypothetical protein
VNDLTEVLKDDRTKHTQAPKKVEIIGSSTRCQEHPKQNTNLLVKNDASPFLAVYVLAKTSKSALSILPVTSLPIKNKPKSKKKKP